MAAPQQRGFQLYVGDLHESITETDILAAFSKVGQVTAVRLAREQITRRFLGYGTVAYGSATDAQKAVDLLNHTMITNSSGVGRHCRVAFKTFGKDPKRDATRRGEETGNLYVKNLPAAMDASNLHDHFSHYGPVLSCKVQRDRETNQSLQYGFVQMADPSVCNRVIAEMNGKTMQLAEGDVATAKPLVIEFFKPRSSRQGESSVRFTNLFIKNIGDADEKALQALCSEFGRVNSVHVRTGPRSGARGPKANEGAPTDIVNYGFGFANFATHEEALRAKEALAKKQLYGVLLEVNEAVSKKRRKEELRFKNKEALKKLLANSDYCNLYIKHLAENVTSSMLADEIQKCVPNHPGAILSCAVMLEKSEFGPDGVFLRPGASRGFAFVCMKTKEDASRVVGMLGRSFIHGKSLHVEYALPREQHKQQVAEAHRRQQFYPAMMYPHGPYFARSYPGPYYGQPPRGAPYGGQQRNYAAPANLRAPAGPQQLPQTTVASYQQPAQQPRSAGTQARATTNPPRQQARPANPSSQKTGKATPKVPQAQAAPEQHTAQLTPALLSELSEQERKFQLGSKLYADVMVSTGNNAERASKVTGMILELDTPDILELIEDKAKLDLKVKEALAVLREHESKEGKRQ